MVLTKTRMLLLLGSIALLTTPASARPSHGGLQFSSDRVEHTDFSAKRRHHATARYAKARSSKVRHAKRYQAHRRYAYRHGRPPMIRSASGLDAYASIPDRHGISQAYQVLPYHVSVPSRSTQRSYATGGGYGIVAEARRYIGTNPTGRSALWCAHFMNMVLERSGHRGSGSGFARSFASYGTRISGPQVGAIAVMSRGRRGGHVGVVSGIDGNGNPIIISGNHGRRVGESVYPRGRVYAYVMP